MNTGLARAPVTEVAAIPLTQMNERVASAGTPLTHVGIHGIRARRAGLDVALLWKSLKLSAQR